MILDRVLRVSCVLYEVWIMVYGSLLFVLHFCYVARRRLEASRHILILRAIQISSVRHNVHVHFCTKYRCDEKTLCN